MTKSELEELLQNKEEDYTKNGKPAKDLENKEKEYETVKESMIKLKQERKDALFS